jgi:hypothetical protein
VAVFGGGCVAFKGGGVAGVVVVDGDFHGILL